MIPGLILPPYKSLITNMVPQATGTPIGPGSSVARVFDGVTDARPGDCFGMDHAGSTAFFGKVYASPITVWKGITFGSNSKGYGDNPSAQYLTVELRANHTAPVAKTEGTLLGSIHFAVSNGSNENVGREILSSDHYNQWECVWLSYTFDTADYPLLVAEIQFFQSLDNN